MKLLLDMGVMISIFGIYVYEKINFFFELDVFVNDVFCVSGIKF